MKAFCTSVGSGVASRKRLRRLQILLFGDLSLWAESEYGNETEHMHRQPEPDNPNFRVVARSGFGAGVQNSRFTLAQECDAQTPGRCIAQLFGTVDSRCIRKQHILQVAGLVKVVMGRSFLSGVRLPIGLDPVKTINPR